MGAMSNVGFLNGWSIRDMLADSFIPCMWCMVQSAKPSLHSNIFCGFLRMHVELILIFQADPVSGYICGP
jgi:hypothetical protein